MEQHVVGDDGADACSCRHEGNQTLAERLWPNQNPLGQRFRSGETIEVVGVARDIRGRSLFESSGPMLYLPLSQHYQASTVIHVRASIEPVELIAALRGEVQALDRHLPVYGIMPLSGHLMATLTPQRLLAHLVTSVGLLAMLLAGIGLYGLLAYTVALRTPEIGLRTALGAPTSVVLRLVVAQGMRLALAGIGLGLVAAVGVTRLLQGVLFGVRPIDPLTFVAAPLLLGVVALAACYLPARRAASVNPKVALRSE